MQLLNIFERRGALPPSHPASFASLHSVIHPHPTHIPPSQKCPSCAPANHNKIEYISFSKKANLEQVTSMERREEIERNGEK